MSDATAQAADGGRLVVVGVGYGVAGHLDARSRVNIERADRVFYLFHDPVTATHVQQLNPNAESLHVAYRADEPGSAAARRMVERMVGAVREGAFVCAAFAGHPAIAVPPALEAVRQVRAAGLPAQVLPSISIEDCLVADLGFDPGKTGRVLFEANDFVRSPRRFDPTAALVLLQPGAVGDDRMVDGSTPNRAGLALLADLLGETYPERHPVVLYEREPIPWVPPRMDRTTLAELAEADVRVMTTLFLPPIGPPEVDPTMLARLGMSSRP